MTTGLPGGTYRVADIDLNRMGYGARQLVGPGAFGPPRGRDGSTSTRSTSSTCASTKKQAGLGRRITGAAR
ncbi:hypothetical protein ACQPW1_20820 [Nocardia sp. CA-128927]|uniref:hypothetical protein n=1 Tax=Nocardia sp. CA-128927 TaxID=3239975 RepID=UPI003D982563